MSDAYAHDRALVSADADVYERALDVAIALTIVWFALGTVALVEAASLDARGGGLADLVVQLLLVGLGTVGLVGLCSYLGVVSISSRRTRGVGLGLVAVLVGTVVAAAVLPVSLGQLLGYGLVVQAVVIGAAGVVSRLGLVDTNPSPSVGLLAAGVFGLIGALFAAALGTILVGGGTMVEAVGGLVGALAFGALAAVPREDVGSTAPVAIVVGTFGLVMAVGLVGPGWQWQPSPNVGGTFTGEVVVPLVVLAGSLVSGWAAGKGRGGFGATGREYGAFLVVNLNALLMVCVMVSIVAFVTMKGITYAFHGFTIGAASALVVLAPVLALAVDAARTPSGTDEWHGGARQAIRITPLAAVGSLAAALGGVVVTGERIVAPFTYTVMGEGREMVPLDTALTVTAEPVVGTLLVFFSGLFLFVKGIREYGTLRGVGDQPAWLVTVQRGAGLGALSLAFASVALTVLGSTSPGSGMIATVGSGLVVFGSVAAGALATLPLIGLVLLPLARLASSPLGRASDTDGLGDRTRDRAQWITVGLFGGLALLTGAILVEPATGVVPNLGPMTVAPTVAVLGLASSMLVAALAAVTRRSTDDANARRVVGEVTTLGLTTGAGFATLLGLHVALTGADFSLAGATVGRVGSLSWPMTMDAYIPLGPKPGGIMPAVVGTVWLVVGASVFAVPLGVGAAVFLTEYAEQGRFTALVEVATNALWSTPSVVFGLFGAAFLIPRFGGDESLLSGMLVLGFMLLPLVLITSREAIKAVPDEYRDASAALGVNRWQTIRSVVLPAALPGVITGVILGVGRIAGETAPLILVLGSTLNSTGAVDVVGGFRFVAEPPFVTNDALLQASAALPTQVWAVIAAGVSGSPSMGWGSAFVLLAVVLTFYAVGIAGRTYFRRKLNHE